MTEKEAVKQVDELIKKLAEHIEERISAEVVSEHEVAEKTIAPCRAGVCKSQNVLALSVKGISYGVIETKNFFGCTLCFIIRIDLNQMVFNG